ncbi:hypothetical protein DFR29_102412 [Tahibacter aquaticus]|uniref:Uncharacterized protein n=1 Tax=Tahibacter aquaticus TaxID=520092 RepID=A0A4R6Z7G3_9GAMM|nr:hypothetical protein DFR29_102412 [Tahibacter aquaticus]
MATRLSLPRLKVRKPEYLPTTARCTPRSHGQGVSAGRRVVGNRSLSQVLRCPAPTLQNSARPRGRGSPAALTAA